MPLLKVLLQVKTHPNTNKEAPRKGLQVVAIASNPRYSNYTKSRFFAVLVSDFPDKTLFGTYKKSHFGAFGRLGGQTKGAKGWKGWKGAKGGECAPPEYLNAPTTATTSTHDKHRDNREGANLAPPGWWSGEGGSYPPYNARYENRK